MRWWSVVLLGTLGGALTVVLGRGWLRVEVDGESMRPTFLPGDRLLARRLPPRRRLRPGQIVVVPDPRPGADRILVKRVVRVGPGWVEVRGDDPARSTDSRILGPLPRASVVATVVRRYAPPR